MRILKSLRILRRPCPGCTLLPGLLLAGLLMSAVRGNAQELEISISPSPVGSGARAAGMGDAFVAIADDATAASWNPAGLVQLERPELSLAGSFNMVRDAFRTSGHPEFDGVHLVDNMDLNYLCFVQPLPMLVFGRNAVVSMNYQRKYDLTREFSFEINQYTFSAPYLGYRGQRLSFEQAGGLGTLSPAFAIELTHHLSVGVTLNLWRSSFLADNGWTQTTDIESTSFLGSTVILGRSHTEESYEDFRGENVTLGVLWNIGDKWNIGARYDSPLHATADYHMRGFSMNGGLAGPTLPRGYFGLFPAYKNERRRVHFPASYAVGVAHRFNDKLTVSADLTRTDWRDFFVRQANGTRQSLVDASMLNSPYTRPELDPTLAVRLGMEYVLLPKQLEERLDNIWTLRAGIFRDQEPATQRSGKGRILADRGSGKPDDFYGGALGLGLQMNQKINFDLAYQVRFGNSVNSDLIRGAGQFEEDVLQHRVLLSMILFF